MQINIPYHLLLVIVCLVIVPDFPSIAAADSILRDDPRLPLQGTRNWKLLEGARFSPRHGHATTVFPCPDDTNDECLWLTGGYSELHRTFDVKQENENNDVYGLARMEQLGIRWQRYMEISFFKVLAMTMQRSVAMRLLGIAGMVILSMHWMAMETV